VADLQRPYFAHATAALADYRPLQIVIVNVSSGSTGGH